METKTLTSKYRAILSYSLKADGALAKALQNGLHRFARPWYRLRSLRVFRDQGSLSANPALWTAIEESLSQSDFFILLASPTAAASDWVQRELEEWLMSHSSTRLLIVWTDGEIVWDEGRS